MPAVDSNTLLLMPLAGDWLDYSPTPITTFDTTRTNEVMKSNTHDPWSVSSGYHYQVHNHDYYQPNYIYTDTGNRFDFGTGDFTVEFWCWFAHVGSPNDDITWLMGARGGAKLFDIQVLSYVVSKTNSPKEFRMNLDSTWYDYWWVTGFNGGLPDERQEWVHVAFVRKNQLMRVFFNGGRTNKTINNTVNITGVNGLYIGRGNGAGTKNNQETFLRMIRISDIARYWDDDFNARDLTNFSTTSYKISGTTNQDATIRVFNSSTGVLIKSQAVTTGAYEITGLDTQTVDVSAEKADGETESYGNVTTIAE